MSVRTSASDEAPEFIEEASLYDDLVTMRFQQTINTVPANVSGSVNLGSPGGATTIGNLLDLNRNQVAELVALEDYNVAMRIEQVDGQGTTPGSVRWDHNLFLRPTESSNNPFIFDDPALELENTENHDIDDDGNTEFEESFSVVETNTLFEDVTTYEGPFNDTTNGSGGGGTATWGISGVFKNYRREYGRGHIAPAGDEIGSGGFVDVDEIDNEPIWMKWQVKTVWDIHELEQEPPTYMDVFRGSMS